MLEHKILDARLLKLYTLDQQGPLAALNIFACPQLDRTYSMPQIMQSTENTGIVYDTKRWAKGKLLDTGVSGIVELLPTGQVIKSAWPEDEESREDIATEARAYQRIFDHFGAHKRFVKHFFYDDLQRTITLEFMVHGTLRAYLELHNNCIHYAQRVRWICALAEGMTMLHSASIVHCDFSPRNMLLDEQLELKVADFGCVSMDGSRSSAGGSARFYPPRVLNCERIEFGDDLFALGSSIFEVLTGKPPYPDLSTCRIQTLYRTNHFPDLTGLEFGDIIRDCWLFRAKSARNLHQRILKLVLSNS